MILFAGAFLALIGEVLAWSIELCFQLVILLFRIVGAILREVWEWTMEQLN